MTGNAPAVASDSGSSTGGVDRAGWLCTEGAGTSRSHRTLQSTEGVSPSARKRSHLSTQRRRVLPGKVCSWSDRSPSSSSMRSKEASTKRASAARASASACAVTAESRTVRATQIARSGDRTEEAGRITASLTNGPGASTCIEFRSESMPQSARLQLKTNTATVCVRELTFQDGALRRISRERCRTASRGHVVSATRNRNAVRQRPPRPPKTVFASDVETRRNGVQRFFSDFVAVSRSAVRSVIDRGAACATACGVRRQKRREEPSPHRARAPQAALQSGSPRGTHTET